MNLHKHERLELALASFAREYCKNMFKYIYEVDVQVLLSQVLDYHFNEPHIIQKQQNKGNRDLTEFDIGKVHREYPAKVLIDNVVFGKPKQLDEVEEALPYKIGFESFYHQPVKYAIELKFVPLYQSGVRNTELSYLDYKRLIGKIEDEKNQFAFNEELEYAIQLTIFQDLQEQTEFLNNHNKIIIEKKHPTWLKWIGDLKTLTIKNKDKVGYYYLDLEDQKVKHVPVG